MAVIKSNAYGHGLVPTAQILVKDPEFNRRGWFGVDSVVEGLRLRKEGIMNPILVLGTTLPSRMVDAEKEKIILSVSNVETLKALAARTIRPQFHLKIDTGMHRQGFFVSDLPRVINVLKKENLKPSGMFTHFSSAKDIAYPTYTHEQLAQFKLAREIMKKAGFNCMAHAAASGGTLLFPESHFDMVRVGMATYGYFPSPESKIHLANNIDLRPVLSWKTIIGEIKEIPAGSFVSYDLTEKVRRKTKIAILPIGYWHGYDRGLSGIGEVLVRGRRARVLGRVTMDMLIVDITAIDNKSKNQNSNIKVGDEVVLLGKYGKEAIWADEIGLKVGTSQYEFLTRINPLIKRVLV